MKTFWATLITTALALPLCAQQPSPASPDKPTAPKQLIEPTPRQPSIPLKVQIVISKYRADKKLSSLPYDLTVNANSGPTMLRIGGDVPVPSGRVQRTDGKAPDTPVSFNFRTVGTRIDCTAFSDEPSRYRLNVSITDDSVMYADDRDPGGLTDIPRFKSFTTSNTLLLKDGQSSQMTTAADPISGEVMRVDVTLIVVK